MCIKRWETLSTGGNTLSTPVLGITAFSGTGKTTLITQLIPSLLKRGVRTSVIKHAHHNFDVDTPGKDSYEIRKAGAKQTLVASANRWALMTETPDNNDVDLTDLIGQLQTDNIDLIIVEGFKNLDIPKIILHRQATGSELPEIMSNTLAIATDDLQLDISLPKLNLNQLEDITEFICQQFELK